MVKEGKTHSGSVEYHTKRGNDEFRLGHFTEAAREYRLASKCAPSNPHVAANLVSALICQKKFDEAETILKSLLKDHENLPRLKYLMGLVYSGQREWQKALACFETVPANDNAHAEAGLCTVRCLLKLNREKDAWGNLDELLRRNPGDVRLASLLLPQLVRRGETDKAVEICRSGKHANPNNVFWHMWLGKLYRSIRNMDLAANEYREVIAIAPNLSIAYQHLGIIESRRGNTEEALKLLKKAVELSPGSATARYNLAQLLFKLGNFSEAKDAYQKAIDINPEFTQAYHGLVRTLMQT